MARIDLRGRPHLPGARQDALGIREARLTYPLVRHYSDELAMSSAQLLLPREFLGSNVRVTNIQPGLTDTDFMLVQSTLRSWVTRERIDALASKPERRVVRLAS